jgi:hypothetical protein
VAWCHSLPEKALSFICMKNYQFALLKRIMSDVKSGARCWITGLPGSGKTFMAQTFAEAGFKPVYMDRYGKVQEIDRGKKRWFVDLPADVAANNQLFEGVMDNPVMVAEQLMLGTKKGKSFILLYLHPSHSLYTLANAGKALGSDPWKEAFEGNALKTPAQLREDVQLHLDEVVLYLYCASDRIEPTKMLAGKAKELDSSVKFFEWAKNNGLSRDKISKMREELATRKVILREYTVKVDLLGINELAGWHGSTTHKMADLKKSIQDLKKRRRG